MDNLETCKYCGTYITDDRALEAWLAKGQVWFCGEDCFRRWDYDQEVVKTYQPPYTRKAMSVLSERVRHGIPHMIEKTTDEMEVKKDRCNQEGNDTQS